MRRLKIIFLVKIGNIELGEIPLLLAPMEDVTDPPFRYVCKMLGADLMYTEFISSEGLIRDAAKSVKKLDFEEVERPVGIQIFGHNIESMVAAAKYAEEAQPDLIDINFGCSVKKVVSKGAGAGILNDIPKMIKMTEEIVKAVKLPVTVKTRLGYDDKHREIVDIAEKIQDTGIKALSIHGRLRTTKYSQPADWTLIGKVTNNPRMHIPIFGNGDISNAETAKYLLDTYGVDGLMIGRATYGNPWIFKEVKHYLKTGELLDKPDIHERVRIIKIQLQRSVDWKGERTGILEMRKHWGNYFKGYPNFKPFKLRLMSTESHQEVLSIVDEIENYYSE